MGKPFNAGIAASNGVEAAMLARRGFISCDDGVGGVQGFIDTHPADVAEAAAWANPPPGTFMFEDNKYKLHACCHGLHAMINALQEARCRHDIAPSQVERVTVRTNPRWLRVCDIKHPRTGLEAKFSYGMLAAMVFHGISTAADGSYTNTLGADPALMEIASRVEAVGDDRVSDTATMVLIDFRTGGRIEVAHDLAAPLAAPALEAGLREKARALIGEATAERLWSGIAGLDRLSARDLGTLINA